MIIPLLKQRERNCSSSKILLCQRALQLKGFSVEVELRTQNDTKKSEAKAKDSPSEDRPTRGQWQDCLRPRPRTKNSGASVLQRKRSSRKIFRRSPKKILQNFFQAFSKKKLQKFFSGDLQKLRSFKIFFWHLQNFNNSKNSAVLEPRAGQFSST